MDSAKKSHKKWVSKFSSTRAILGKLICSCHQAHQTRGVCKSCIWRYRFWLIIQTRRGSGLKVDIRSGNQKLEERGGSQTRTGLS